ncbi:purine-cytosine permease-like protein [Brevibacterium sanguinis]|uniref:Purine-cytosine permease-like protein n=2 Tax=Brevibacterium TaxID=1696 RepID=A0A366IH03_9MICO|nr:MULTISPECIES: cytosine permease [Brevibacterium]RBP63141.1 purine-cytosine permease-like protein [Brevibacterium sanguinis]RBP69683.1 purine-cytosine permease-like protein [Brevibacterium celere]
MTTSTDPELLDSPTHAERRGIELVTDAERHGHARDLFAVWAAPNVSVLNFTIGATLTLLGLEIWQSALVILASNLLWIFPGIVAASGPAAGTSGSVVQRAIYGIRGNKVVIAFYGWFISGVFLALNWVASSFMGAELLTRWGWGDKTLALVLVTVVVSLITVLVAVFGHGLILRAYTAVTLLLLVIFLAVTGFVLPQIDWSFTQPEPLQGIALWSSLTIGFAIMASTPLSYSNSADLARYLPRDTSPVRIAAATAFGGAIPCFFFTMVGALLATAVPAESIDLGIEYALLDMLPVWLGPIFVIGVILNTIALNGMTTYTASMAFQSIGIPIRRIPSAVVIGVLGTLFTIYLVMSTSLLDAVNIMLQLLILISAPTIAIYVTDILLRRNRYDGVALFQESPEGPFWYHGGWSLSGLSSVVLGACAGSLFMTTDVFSGPFAVAMGYLDLSVPVCLLVSSGLYVLFAHRQVHRQASLAAV